MNRFAFLSLCSLAFSSVFGQDNYVAGKIILRNGESIDVQINDLLWKKIPGSFDYRVIDNVIKQALPLDVSEVVIGSKSIYRSFLVTYDSSPNKGGDVSKNKEPEYETEPMFLKVLFDSDISLLMGIIKSEERFFIQSGGKVEELVDHHFKIIMEGQPIVMENKIFVKQLAVAFQACNKISIDPKLKYGYKYFIDLFSSYAACNTQSFKLFQKNEKNVVKFGVVGTLASDLMTGNFKGGVGYGAGVFVNSYLPFKVYKYSIYGDLSYRAFGNQTWTGKDYVGLPYKETHQIRSIKATSIIRTRLGKKASLPTMGYTYAGAGLTASFGLKDLYQRGPYTATSAAPFAGLVLNAGIYLSKNIVLDIKAERGSSILYSDYLNQDNREPKSTKGFYALQANLLFEF